MDFNTINPAPVSSSTVNTSPKVTSNNVETTSSENQKVSTTPILETKQSNVDIRTDIQDTNTIPTFEEAIKSANKILMPTGREFEYRIHEKTHRITIKVIDTDSREIIKELPPEKELDVLAKMWELAGILVDKKG